MLKPFVGAGLALALTSSIAMAADLPSRKGAPIAPAASASCFETNGLPTDVFGFTTGSDVSDLGAWGGTLTANGAATGRATRLTSVTGVAQIATSPIRCFEVGPYLYLGGTSAKDRFGFNGSNTLYGGGVEFKYKFLGRDTHGVGATLDVDVSANGGRFSGILGAGNDTAYNLAVRLFLDRHLGGNLYGALNLEHISSFSNAAGVFTDASQFNVRAALSAKVASNFFVGAEAWYSRTYVNGAFYKAFAGDGLFLGPNFLWQINDKWTLNAAYQVQVTGKARATPGNLNLASYNQHYARVKLGYSF